VIVLLVVAITLAAIALADWFLWGELQGKRTRKAPARLGRSSG
jgi:hypothetical protein